MRRCGTVSAYTAGCRCQECRDARRRYDRAHRLHGHGLVDSLGTVRRLRALSAIGWSQSYLAARLGKATSAVHILVVGRHDRVQRRIADAVAALYDELSMTPGPSEYARTTARRNGWAAPLAWDEDAIDQPDARPQGMAS